MRTDEGALERIVDSVELDRLRIWDFRPSTGMRVVGVLHISGEAPVALRGRVVFAGISGGREFCKVAFRPESWDGFLVLVRHRARRAGEVTLPLAA